MRPTLVLAALALLALPLATTPAGAHHSNKSDHARELLNLSSSKKARPSKTRPGKAKRGKTSKPQYLRAAPAR
jgi:hypothetical protein